MDSIDRFDPFNNRLCRNVRNALSEAFAAAVESKDLRPVTDVVRAFGDQPLPDCVSDYLRRRLGAYEAVLMQLDAVAPADPLAVALVIWDRRLFFETHEYLEQHWKSATGDDKRLFQALIRAAGAYVHLEQGNRSAAERIAGKAIAGLLHVKQRLAVYTDPQHLIDKLKSLDPVPPMLSGTADPGASASRR